MAYLTEAEFQELGYELSNPSLFKRYLNEASTLLDIITMNYYRKHDLQEDKTLRAERFKQAIAKQIAHFDDNGGTSVANFEQYSSVTIGRTSVRYADNKRLADMPTLSGDVLITLSGTGLLNRGVCNV